MGYAQPGPVPGPAYRELIAGEPASLTDAVQVESKVEQAAEFEYIRRRAAELVRERIAEERAMLLFSEPAVYRNFSEVDRALSTGDVDPLVIGGGLMGEGDLVTLTGKAKKGKTTFVYNLVGCLTEGRPFLDHEQFNVDRPYRVCIFDGEMNGGLWVRRMQGLNPQRPDVFLPIFFRGHNLDLCTRLGVEYAIRRLSDFGAEVWIIDNFSKFSHSVQSTNDDVEINRFHQHVQEVQERVPSLMATLLIHHAGHSAARARGSSAFRDRPDVLWDMTKDDPPEFLVSGRHAPEFAVRTLWNPETNELTYRTSDVDVGVVDPGQQRSLRERIMEVVLETPGLSRSKIINKISNKRYTALSGEIDSMVAAGILRGEKSGRYFHYFAGALAGGESNVDQES